MSSDEKPWHTCPKSIVVGAAHTMTGGACIRCGWEDPITKSLMAQPKLVGLVPGQELSGTLKALRTHWEYRFLSLPTSTDEMNALGDEGWEVVGFAETFFFFKRPKAE